MSINMANLPEAARTPEPRVRNSDFGRPISARVSTGGLRGPRGSLLPIRRLKEMASQIQVANLDQGLLQASSFCHNRLLDAKKVPTQLKRGQGCGWGSTV